jgi:hypothetical protein
MMTEPPQDRDYTVTSFGEHAISSIASPSLYARANSGVTVYIAPNCKAAADRIELSSGTRVADASETSADNQAAAYEEGARLPREPWRSPTDKEIASLIDTEIPQNAANSIAIIKLPHELTDEFCAMIRNVDIETLETDLLQPLRTICELGEPLHCLGASANPPNLKTVTINRGTGRFNGLHVDNWEGLDINSRHLAANRICINISKSDRYFLFVPISLIDMARLLTGDMGPQSQMPRRYTEIGRQFLARFPEVPTVRCRIAPGEAYIAPTENLVHDGSSLGQSGTDEQFTIRGHIRPLGARVPSQKCLSTK